MDLEDLIRDESRRHFEGYPGQRRDVAELLLNAANEIARLRTAFRINMLRLAPETSHAEIDRILNDA